MKRKYIVKPKWAYGETTWTIWRLERSRWYPEGRYWHWTHVDSQYRARQIVTALNKCESRHHHFTYH